MVNLEMYKLLYWSTNIIIERLAVQEIEEVPEENSQCLPRNENREETKPNREKPLLTFSKADFIQAISPKKRKWQCKKPVTLENCRPVSSAPVTRKHLKGFRGSKGCPFNSSKLSIWVRKANTISGKNILVSSFMNSPHYARKQKA